MHTIAVIPARYASARFPGKVLADRTGKPLIQHVHERALLAESIERVIVATDDERIADAVRGFGGDVVMTRADHPNGTSRIAEVIETIPAEVIVNVQGDEPEIEPGLIDHVVHTLQDHSECHAATVASPFAPDEDPTNPNIVKVVIDQAGRAMYFSRSLIPHPTQSGGIAPLKHVGMYAYRATFLKTYVSMPATPLEQSERLEQLRILEQGYRIAVAMGDVRHHGIDTPEQYEAFVKRATTA